MSLIEETFNKEMIRLPSVERISELGVVFDHEDFLSRTAEGSSLRTYEIRDEYVKRNFAILSDEFLRAVKSVCDRLNIRSAVELAAGAGWFSFWMRKYEVPIVAVIDNMDWKRRWNETLNIVEKNDAVKFMAKHPNIDLWILCWPYMDDLAEKIWDAMKSSQYLLYVGESSGGCNASDEFFDLVEDIENKELGEDLGRFFVSFWGIHDRPGIYRKDIEGKVKG